MNQQMSVQDIIKADCERYGFDFEKFYVGLLAQIKDGSMRIMRHGNTLLAYYIIEPHVAEVHLITADPVPNLVEAIKNLYAAMKKAGFVKTVSTSQDRSVEALLRRAGIKFKVSPKQEMVQGKMVSGYEIVAEA